MGRPSVFSAEVAVVIKVKVDGGETLEIRHLVLDFNGTVARDGILIEGVAERLAKISEKGVEIRLITADTNGTARRQCAALPVDVEVVEGSEAGSRKKSLVRELGAAATAAVGNGRNDRDMLAESGLAISVVGPEGCFGGNIAVSDIVVANILDALDLLVHEHRIRATLRH